MSSPANSSVSAKPSAPDITTLIECVLPHRWLCLILSSVFAVAGAAAGRFGVPARYKATAMVRLGNPSGVVDNPNESGNAQREFRSNQQELIRMPHLLRRAADSPKLADLPELAELRKSPDEAEQLGSRLELELPRNSEVLRISIQDNRPEAAYLLANAVTDAYLEEVRRANSENVEKRIAVLDKLHTTAEERLGKSWLELQTLARELGSGNPAALSLQAQAEVENYRFYTQRLRVLQADKRDAAQAVKSIEESPETLSKEIDKSESMNSVRFAMYTAMLKREQALAKWGPNHPEVQAAKREESVLREYYQKTLTDQAKAKEPRNKKEDLLAGPLATISRLSNEEQTLESLTKEIDDRLQVLGGDSSSKLEILRNGIARMEKLSDRLWQTRENLLVEKNADQRVQLVSYATLPTKRDNTKRNKLTMVLAGAGFGLAMFLVALGELLTGRIHSLRDAAKRTGLEMLGELGEVLETVSLSELQTVLQGSDQALALRSQLNMLAAKLIHHPAAEKARTILVTSAITNQERASLASYLAATLAWTGKKTVAINLDVRNPTACVHFTESLGGELTEWLDIVPKSVRAAWSEESTGRGLTEWLDRGYGCDELKLHDDVPNLSLLPVEKRTAESLTVVTHARLAGLVSQLKERYDYVVIDAAPVLELPDALHLGRLADVAVLSVLKGVSRSASVVRAKECLEKIGVPVLGAMILRVKHTDQRAALVA